jgi:serine/threonine protein kinase/tetratricopeptide (TPR) repeat protein
MSLSKPELEQIKTLGKEFQKCLREGQTPRIEDFLKKVTLDARENLFSILLQIELRIMERNGQSPSSFEFIKRFPNYAGLIRQAFFESTQMSMSDEHRPTLDTDESVLTKAFGLPNSSRLGEYELIRQLGRGGFGVVYEARHLTRQNVVALKTLPAASEGHEVNADRLHKFRKEFRSLSEYNHPNLVGMQTLEVDDGNWFFTMDLIEGTDFLSFVRPNNELNENRLRKSIAQLAIGIIALHEQGIVHRDLKPSNVMVETNGQVKILDFGLVAELQTATDQTASLRSAQFAGTPRYAAPEQMFGDRTEATDWYAFGVMLFEALTSEAPFKGNQMELLRQKQNDDPPLLFGREGVSEDLAQLTDSLLNREPQERIVATEIIKLLQLDLETRTFGSKTALGSAGSYGSTGSIDEVDNLDLNWEEEEIELIGREEQLAQLNSAKQELLDKREPVVVFIKGLSGEGKSSLAEKFLRPLRRGEEMLVLSGRCYDRESVPYKVIDSIIEPLVRFLRSSKAETIRTVLPPDIRLLAYLFPILRRVDAIASIPGDGIEQMDNGKRKYRAFAALKALLFNISRKLPLVIAIDDLQWGDADSAQALFEWLNTEDSPQLLLLGSYRSDEEADSLFLQMWERRATESNLSSNPQLVEVAPLSLNQCVELTAIRTNTESDFIRKHSSELFKDSGGNPYLLEQLLEGFDPQTGTILQVPLDKIIASRLEKLHPQAALILEVISVSGQPLSIEEALSAIGCSSSHIGTLTHMRSERLVRLLGTGDETLVDTYHDKIRESVLAGLSTSRRRELHFKLAETIEDGEEHSAELWLQDLKSSTTPGEYQQKMSVRLVDLALHYNASGDPRAFVYQLLAAEQALMAFAVDDAIAFFDRAQAQLPRDVCHTIMYRMSIAIGRVHQWNKDAAQALKSYKTAIHFAKSPEDIAKAYGGRTSVCGQTGQFDEAHLNLTQALKQLGISPSKTSVGSLLSIAVKSIRILLIPASWQSLRTEEQKRHSILAHKIFENNQIAFEKKIISAVDISLHSVMQAIKSGEPRNIGLGYSEAAYTWSAFGLHLFGNLCLRRSGRIESELDDDEFRGYWFYCRATALYWGGDLQQSAKFYELAIPLLRRCQNLLSLQVGLHMNRHLLAFAGSATEELAAAESVFKLAGATGTRQGKCWGAYDLANALSRNGRLIEAANYMKLANATLTGERYYMTEAIRASTDGYLRLQFSDYNSARKLAKFAWKTSSQKLLFMDVTLLCLPILIEAISGPNWNEPLPIGDRKFLKQILRRSTLLYITIPNHQPHLLRVSGRAACSLGKKQKAIRKFEKAIKVAAKKGIHYQHAKSLLDLAAVKEEGRKQNRSEAIALLKKMESVIPRAESWLLGDQYDEAVVALEFDLDAWEKEHGPITPYLNEKEATIGLDTMKTESGM